MYSSPARRQKVRIVYSVLTWSCPLEDEIELLSPQRTHICAIEAVEQLPELTRHRVLIHRRTHHQHIGLLHAPKHLLVLVIIVLLSRRIDFIVYQVQHLVILSIQQLSRHCRRVAVTVRVPVYKQYHSLLVT